MPGICGELLPPPYPLPAYRSGRLRKEGALYTTLLAFGEHPSLPRRGFVSLMLRESNMTRIFNKASETRKRKKLRNNLPLAEVILWAKLKKGQLEGYKFRRQCSIGRYVVDFYCPRTKLAIEIDGPSHIGEEAREYDKMRKEFIESANVKVIRFTNDQILKDANGVVSVILTEMIN